MVDLRQAKEVPLFAHTRPPGRTGRQPGLESIIIHNTLDQFLLKFAYIFTLEPSCSKAG